MKLNFLLCFFTLSGITCCAQTSKSLTAFYNKDSTLIGFKNQNGNIEIKPKFSELTRANKFDNIIAAFEEYNDTYKSYYLTRSGKIVGRDCLYIFDNGVDCESEGFIRFSDNETHKTGMFNANGDIAIPAEYNNLTQVRNGMKAAQKGAYWDETKRSEINEFPWIGGEDVLIDTNNNVLIENFVFDNNINFYSLQISTLPGKDTIRQNFKAVDGRYFSFINFEKEFTVWLKSSLLKNFTKSILRNASFKKITYWKEDTGWISEAKKSFIDRNFEIIRTKLLKLNSKNCTYDIFDEGLNPFIFETGEYKKYYNNCGESKDWIYPIKSVVISYTLKNNTVQDNFDFLRTDEGYKLLSISIKKGTPKPNYK